MRDWLKSDKSAAVLRWVMLVSCLALILSWARMNRYEALLASRGGGIIVFQLAFTLERAQEILTQWGTDGIAAARTGINVDFFFLLSYALFFSSFTLMLARPQRRRLFNIGIIAGVLPIAAALLDLTENLLHLGMLSDPASLAEGIVLAVGIISTVKFLLLMITSLYWLLAVIGLIRHPGLWSRGGADPPVDDDPPLW